MYCKRFKEQGMGAGDAVGGEVAIKDSTSSPAGSLIAG